MTAPLHLCKWHLVLVLCTLFALSLAGCGSGQPVRVLAEGETTLSASIGGPIVPSTSPVGIVPYLTAGTAYGVTNDISVHGNLHLIMSVFAVGGLDLGASARLIHQDAAVPELTLSTRLIGFMKFGDPVSPRLYPDVALNASWEIASRTLAYVGTHGTFQWKPGAFYLSPFIGIQFPVSSAICIQTELIWQAANHDTRIGIFEGSSSIGGMGSFGGFIAGVITL